MKESEVAQSASGGKRQRRKNTGEADVLAKTLKVARISERAGSGDSDLIAALADVRRAIERATTIGAKRRAAINRDYYTGVNTSLGASLLDAFTQTRSSWTSLSALVDDMKSKIQGAPIYKLPTEVMLTLFSYVDTKTLFACKSTCQEWKAILTSTAASNEVWAKKPPEMHGTLKSLDAKWEEIKKIYYRPTTLSLKVQDSRRGRSPYHQLGHVGNLRVVKEFPSRWLRSFTYQGPQWPMWDCVKQCPLLKILHWKSEDRSTCVANYGVGRGSPLASCRLDEFVFEIKTKGEVDSTFMRMLTQARRLHIHGGVDPSHVSATFKATADCLEEVMFSNLQTIWPESRADTIESGFTMTRLESISILDSTIANLSIRAPQANPVRFVHSNFSDWVLIESCRSKLKSLHIETEGFRKVGRLGREIFDMPALEDLHLDYTHGVMSTRVETIHKEPIVRYEDYSTAALWQSLDNNDLTKAHLILPKLKKLKIIHDPMLDEELLLKFIERRAVIGQPAIELMDISLANHLSDQTDRLDAIQVTRAGFTYKRFEDWEGTNTTEWSLTTELTYWEPICWEGLNQCRSILKELQVMDKGQHWDGEWAIADIAHEIFNFPQLEVLDLNFGACGKDDERSAKALWKLVSTGSTCSDGVSLQDVLPKLRTLIVYEDTSLDEETILSFIDLRKCLGLTMIEEMSINLAQRCSQKTSKLEQLKITMPGFQYWRYRDGETESAEAECPEYPDYPEYPEYSG